MESIDKIIGNILPNAKDMELIYEYGLLKWTMVFAIKVVFVVLVLWFIFEYLGLEFRFGQKKRNKVNLKN